MKRKNKYTPVGVIIALIFATVLWAGTGVGERAERFQLKTVPKGATVDLAKM